MPDGQAAFGLKRVLPDLVLPAALRATIIHAEESASELLDAIARRCSVDATPARRAGVEQGRLYVLGARFANLEIIENLDPSREAEAP